MSLESSITALAQAIGADIKALHSASAPAVGTVYTGLQSPGAQWLQAGGVYPSADYPDLYAALGLPEQGVWAPVTRYMPQNAEWSSIAYSTTSAVFVAIARGTDLAATSPDGVTWTLGTLPVSGDWVAVIFNSGVFSTVAKGTDIALTSTDGITWTQGVLPVSAEWEVGGVARVAAGFGALPMSTFVAGATGDVVRFTGSSWVKSPLPLPALVRWGAICRSNGVNILLPYDGDIALTSTNAAGTWTPRTLPQSAQWRSIAYGNGVFVAVATAGDIAATSPDGIMWTQRTLPASASWGCVVFGAGQFIALAGSDSEPSNVAATSPDGIAWTLRTLPLVLDWRAGAYKEGLFAFVAAGTNGAATLPVALPTFLVPPAAAVASPYKQWVKAG